MTNGTLEIDPKMSSLVARLLERRVVALYKEVRSERAAIAERMSAKGLVGGGSVYEVTKAFTDGFEAYARGALQDVLDLVRESAGTIDGKASGWIKDLLENNFERVAENLCSDVSGGGPLDAKRQTAVRNAMVTSVAAMKRDLGIELDRIALQDTRPVVVNDPALFDPLVPLQNRRGFDLQFQTVTKDSNEHVSLVLIDIDDFKDVNDKHGSHAIGDEALVSVAQVAAACVRGKGNAYRIGGDEFALLLPNHTLQEGLAVAERFRKEINASPRTSRELTISVSVGVAVWPTHGADLKTLKNAADRALYDAKDRRRNLVRYFGEPEPIVSGPREVERKQPEPGGLSADEQLTIRQDYFRSGIARCPRDKARLHVIDATAQQDPRNTILITCPLCGLSETLA